MDSLIRNFPWTYFKLKIAPMSEEDEESLNKNLHHVTRFERKSKLATNQDIEWIQYNQKKSKTSACKQCHTEFKPNSMILFSKTYKLRLCKSCARIRMVGNLKDSEEETEEGETQ